MTDPYTMEARLCDDEGLVSGELVDPPNAFNPVLTYLGQLNNLRRHGGLAPYPDNTPPFPCTGSAHLAGNHIRCTSPAHRAGGPTERRWHAAGEALGYTVTSDEREPPSDG